VFSDLVRDEQGRAHARIEGKKQRLELLIGPNWRGLTVWSPNPAGTGRGSNAFSANPPARSPGAPHALRQAGAGSELHLLRAAGGDRQRVESRAQGTLQGAAVHSTRRHMGGELLDQDERVYSRSVIGDGRLYVREPGRFGYLRILPPTRCRDEPGRQCPGTFSAFTSWPIVVLNTRARLY
jgi:hypothetical protein